MNATDAVSLPPAGPAQADWTRGGDAVLYQQCGACDHVWYFRRAFCPACGVSPPRDLKSAGLGSVHAGTVVHRAPTDEFRALAPYRILLVDLDEGFRMMAHGDLGLAIGDRVRCRFRSLGDRLLPHFEKEKG